MLINTSRHHAKYRPKDIKGKAYLNGLAPVACIVIPRLVETRRDARFFKAGYSGNSRCDQKRKMYKRAVKNTVAAVVLANKNARRLRLLKSEQAAMLNTRGMRFPIEVILVCIHWYVAYSLSYRHLEEMMQEFGSFDL